MTHNHCMICREKLPCRLPAEDRSSRCAACQKLAYQGRQQGGTANPFSCCPQIRAEIERRIAMYAARAERGEPIFGRA